MFSEVGLTIRKLLLLLWYYSLYYLEKTVLDRSVSKSGAESWLLSQRNYHWSKRQCAQAEAWRISWLYQLVCWQVLSVYKQPDFCLVLVGIMEKRLKEKLSLQPVVLIKHKVQLLFERYTDWWWKMLQITRIRHQIKTSWFFFFFFTYSSSFLTKQLQLEKRQGYPGDSIEVSLKLHLNIVLLLDPKPASHFSNSSKFSRSSMSCIHLKLFCLLWQRSLTLVLCIKFNIIWIFVVWSRSIQTASKWILKRAH